MPLKFKDRAEFQNFICNCMSLSPIPTSLILDDETYGMVTHRDAKSWGHGRCETFTPNDCTIELRSNYYNELEKALEDLEEELKKEKQK